MTKEALLAELEQAARTMPTLGDCGQRPIEELAPWFGRAAALITRWNGIRGVEWSAAADRLRGHSREVARASYNSLSRILHEAVADLQMELGLSSVVVAEGQVFDYFDEVRKLVEAARADVLFVDPYLDADFVARYLPFVAQGVTIRLLTSSKRLATLLPAVDLFAQQSQATIMVRTSNSLHDRFVFVDQRECHLSGGSFKDGAKRAPTVIAQVTDAFPLMSQTYEQIWATASVQR